MLKQPAESLLCSNRNGARRGQERGREEEVRASLCMHELVLNICIRPARYNL